MQGELQRVEREVRELDCKLNHLIDVVMASYLAQQAILAKLDLLISLLQPATDYPASTGGTITVR